MSSQLKSEKIRVVTTGGSGTSAGNQDSDRVISGELLGFYIEYGTAPSTTDVIIKTAGVSHPSETIWTDVNANTDKYVAIRRVASNEVDVDIAASAVPYCVNDRININVAQSDDAAAGAEDVQVTIFYRD